MDFKKSLLAIFVFAMVFMLVEIPQVASATDLSFGSIGINAKLGLAKTEYSPIEVNGDVSEKSDQLCYLVGAEFVLPLKFSVGLAVSGRESDDFSSFGIEPHVKKYLGGGRITPYLDVFAIQSWNEEELKDFDVSGGATSLKGKTYDKEYTYWGGGVGCLVFLQDSFAADVYARAYTDNFKWDTNTDEWSDNWASEIYIGISFWLK